MKRSAYVLGLLLIAGIFAFQSPASWAGRHGGPASQQIYITAGDTVSFDIPFRQGPAVVSVIGNGQTALFLFMYDSDGHVSTGVGFGTSRTVRMDVYRPGILQVQIYNGGLHDTNAVVMTN